MSNLINNEIVLKDKTLIELNQSHHNTDTSIQKLEMTNVILSYDNLLKAELPERKKILPWLPEGGLIMVSAERGLGKTHFALSLAAAISNNQPFMKWQLSNAAGVLYIDGEMVLSEIRERLKLFLPAVPTMTLNILSHEWFYNKLERDLAVSDDDIQQAILNELDSNSFTRVIILDNLSSLTRIREDKSDDWRAFMLPFLIACRRRGAAVVLIHHCGKSGDQRGSGAREDHLDTSIRLTKLAEYTNIEGCCFQVNFTKSRVCYGKEIEPFVATLAHNNGLATWNIEAVNVSNKDKLYQLIAEKRETGLSVTEAANQLGVHKSLISRFKKQLEEEGYIAITRGKTPMKILTSSNAKN